MLRPLLAVTALLCLLGPLTADEELTYLANGTVYQVDSGDLTSDAAKSLFTGLRDCQRLRWSPDGQYLLAWGAKHVELWRQGGETPAACPDTATIRAASWLPDSSGALLVVEGALQLLTLDGKLTPVEIDNKHGAIAGAAVDQQGTLVLLHLKEDPPALDQQFGPLILRISVRKWPVNAENKVRVWRMADDYRPFSMSLGGPVFMPQGALFVVPRGAQPQPPQWFDVIKDGVVRLLDVGDGTCPPLYISKANRWFRLSPKKADADGPVTTQLLRISQGSSTFLPFADSRTEVDLRGVVDTAAIAPSGATAAFLVKTPPAKRLWWLQQPPGGKWKVSEVRTHTDANDIAWRVSPPSPPKATAPVTTPAEVTPPPTPSPKPGVGNWIACVSAKGLLLVRPEVKDPKADILTIMDAKEGPISHPSWSGNGRYLVYTLANKLCCYDMETGQSAPVKVEGTVAAPCWRPNTQEIWFFHRTSPIEPLRLTRVLREETGKPTAFGTAMGSPLRMDWSSDGKTLFITIKTDSSTNAVTRFDPETNQLQPLKVHAEMPPAYHAWSRALPARWAAVALYGGPRQGVNVVVGDESNTVTGCPVTLRAKEALDGRSLAWPTWSPDGGKLAFCLRLSPDTEYGALLTVSATGGERLEVHPDLKAVKEPAWSPR